MKNKRFFFAGEESILGVRSPGQASASGTVGSPPPRS